MDIRHPGWRDELEDTNYPFMDEATLDNGQGAIILRQTFIDAALYPVGAEAPLYLSSVKVTPYQVTLIIGDKTRPVVASGSFDPRNPPSVIDLYDTKGRPAGTFISSPTRLAVFSSWGVGEHHFTPEQTMFVAAVSFPSPEIGVRGIELPDGQVVTGDVWLVGDNGIVLECYEQHRQLPDGSILSQPTVRIHAVGDPLFRRKLCKAPEFFQTPRFLQEICFIVPEQIIGGISSSSVGVPTADILFLCDTTGSMGVAIDQINRVFPDVVRGLNDRLGNPDILWAAAEYKDFGDPFIWRVNQSFTSNANDVASAIANWRAYGGGDWPEAQFIAMRDIADRWITQLLGRSPDQARRVIVWIGDAPGWENGSIYPTLETVQQRLTEEQIRLLGLNVYEANDGIDEDLVQNRADGSYTTANQATRLAGANNVLHNIRSLSAQELIDWLVARLTEAVIGGQPPIIIPPTKICCQAGAHGDVKIRIKPMPNTVLRVSPDPEGMIVEMGGTKTGEV
jgi:hypothetical protein